jgi:hypothetical protein
VQHLNQTSPQHTQQVFHIGLRIAAGPQYVGAASGVISVGIQLAGRTVVEDAIDCRLRCHAQSKLDGRSRHVVEKMIEKLIEIS